MATDGKHTDIIVGVQLDLSGPMAPVVFCRYDDDQTSATRPVLARGQRVRVDPGRGAPTQEGVVTIAPEQIIAASLRDDAPRVVAAAVPRGSRAAIVVAGARSEGAPDAPIDTPAAACPPVGDADLTHPSRSEGDVGLALTFLPADDADLTAVDLAQALRLAALPLPEAPPPRERDGERPRQ